MSLCRVQKTPALLACNWAIYMKYVRVDSVVNRAGPEGVRSKFLVERSSGHSWFRRVTSPSTYPSRNLVFVVFIWTQSIYFFATLCGPVSSPFYQYSTNLVFRCNYGLTIILSKQTSSDLLLLPISFKEKSWGLLHSKYSFYFIYFRYSLTPPIYINIYLEINKLLKILRIQQ